MTDDAHAETQRQVLKLIDDLYAGAPAEIVAAARKYALRDDAFNRTAIKAGAAIDQLDPATKSHGRQPH